MAKKKASGEKGNALGNVTDYRHENATRVNIPPAKIAAEGAIPKVSDVRYDYSPRRPPTLQFDQHGVPDKLFDLLERARQRTLTEDEAKVLAEVLRTHEPWLEWAGKREAKSFEVDPVALMIRTAPQDLDVKQPLFKSRDRRLPYRELWLGQGRFAA